MSHMVAFRSAAWPERPGAGKRLRPNGLANWELRLDPFRVFYNIEEAHGLVLVVAIGWKDRNRLIIGGKEFEL